MRLSLSVGPLLAMLVSSLAQGAGTSCAVATRGLAFGAYDPFSPQANDSVGEFTVTCFGTARTTVAYQILLTAGGNGSLTGRFLSDGPNRLSYALYLDPARVRIWGDGTSGTGVVGDSFVIGGYPLTRNYIVYGRISPRQDVTAGTYQDTVFVTLNYQ